MSYRQQQKRQLRSRKYDEFGDDYMEDYGNSKSQRASNTFSLFWACFILISGCCSYYAVYLVGNSLPDGISIKESNINSSKFSGERSQQILHRIAKLGPKLVGSHINEVEVPKILMEELEKLKNVAHPSKTLEYELQKGSGAYVLEFSPPFVNIYENVQNVVAIIKGSIGSKSIVINCHYDSAPTSSGASDDGLACAAMIEIARALVTSPERYEHNVVFLFNGAEESPLQGSHLFTKHKWAQPGSIVINLEAAGLGGQSILFQTSAHKTWLLKYFSENALHPTGTVTGEEIFQSGIIPSDTDFRIFRDFGNMTGYDFAFPRNGHVYHTVYDSEEYIPVGSHQHLGDNILALVRALANANEIYHPDEGSGSRMVFFDYIGLFLISYTEETGRLINAATILLSLVSIYFYRRRYSKVSVKEIALSIFSRLLGMLGAVLGCVLSGYLIDYIYPLSMPWYSNVWLIFPLYWCPGIVSYASICLTVDSQRINKRGYSHVSSSQLAIISYQSIMTFVLFIAVCANIRSACMIMIPVMLSSMANFIIYGTTLYRKLQKWAPFYIVMNLPFLFLSFHLIVQLYALFIPVMGRSGPLNADVTIGLITSLAMIFTLSFIMPLLSVVRKPLIFLLVLLGITLGTVLLSVSSSIGHPYRAGPENPAPQRFWIMHTERKFYDEKNVLKQQDSGYFMLNYDKNTQKVIPLTQSKGARSVTEDCSTKMYCGIPLYSGRMVGLGAKGTWIPSVPPAFPKETSLNVNQKVCTTDSHCTLHLSLSGPDRFTVIFSPKLGNDLTDWSIGVPKKHSSIWNDRLLYHLHIVRGEVNGPFNLTLSFNVKDTSSPIADISVTGNYIHNEKERVLKYNEFINSLPDYVATIGWISSYNSYII